MFTCPISHETMTDPVIDPHDGVSYDRVSYEAWLDRHHTSVQTRRPLTKAMLVPNRALKEAIARHRAAAAAAPAPPPPLVDCPARVSLLADGTHVVARVRGPTQPRTPKTMVLAMDVSGSMDADAPCKGPGERLGLSVLDVCVAAGQVLIESLCKGDRLAIISYARDAVVRMGFQHMTEDGKSHAKAVLEGLGAGGPTNFWHSLTTAMDLCRDVPQAVIFNLTDGVPNMGAPARGYRAAMDKLVVGRDTMLCTFGFGEAIDTDVLCDVADATGGRFVYIPDVNFIGTSFVHAVANTLERIGNRVHVVADGVSHAVALKNGGVSHVVLAAVPHDVALRAGDHVVAHESAAVVADADCVRVHRVREAFVHLLATATPMDAKARLATWLSQVDAALGGAADAAARKALEGMRYDCVGDAGTEGQVSMALHTYWDTWGKHYVRSLAYAHRYEEAHNFKDPGVQGYGGPLFQAERDRLDDMYNAMPPPKASGMSRFRSLGRGPVSMATYNFSGGCLAGGCLVTRADGTAVPIMDLRPGDVVRDPFTASQVAVVQKVFVLPQRPRPMVTLGGLCITPYHPMYRDGTWVFPMDEASATSVVDAHVYDVMTSGHALLVDGVPCATWGHELTGDVVGHAFFGSRSAITRALGSHPEWASGVVHVTQEFQRGCGGRVVGCVVDDV